MGMSFHDIQQYKKRFGGEMAFAVSLLFLQKLTYFHKKKVDKETKV